MRASAELSAPREYRFEADAAASPERADALALEELQASLGATATRIACAFRGKAAATR